MKKKKKKKRYKAFLHIILLIKDSVQEKNNFIET